MKKIISALIISIVMFMNCGSLVFAADGNTEAEIKQEIYWDEDKKVWSTDNQSYVGNAKAWFNDYFFWWWETKEQVWEKWTWNLMMNIAKDLKNVLIAVAVIYWFMLAFRLFFGQWGEDDIKKWRLGLLWTSIGIAVMQISYTVVDTLFQKDIDGDTANNFYKAVLIPIVNIMEVSASFVFIWIAILAFYRIISSSGNEEWYKKWVSTIVNAVIGFMMVKISGVLVKSVYWDIKCEETAWISTDCVVWDHNLSRTVGIIAKVIQYMTGFIGIISIILIIYAAFLILTSGWDEAKVKKWKSVIKFIFIWIILIASSVWIFYLITWADYTWWFIGWYGK